jgi:hypothetical protein
MCVTRGNGKKECLEIGIAIKVLLEGGEKNLVEREVDLGLFI